MGSFLLAVVRDRTLADEFEYGDEETGMVNDFGQSPKGLRGSFVDERPKPDREYDIDDEFHHEIRSNKGGKHKHSHKKEADKAHRPQKKILPISADIDDYFSSEEKKGGKHKHSHKKEADKAHKHLGKGPPMDRPRDIDDDFSS